MTCPYCQSLVIYFVRISENKEVFCCDKCKQLIEIEMNGIITAGY